jgi:hypothetical protein
MLLPFLSDQHAMLVAARRRRCDGGESTEMRRKTMMTMLTEQDVHDALFAHNTKQLARTERCKPESLIRELANNDEEAAEHLAGYQHGLVLLRDYIVLMSERSVVGGRFDAETAARVVSPIVSVTSGHIATSEAYRSVALAQR